MDDNTELINLREENEKLKDIIKRFFFIAEEDGKVYSQDGYIEVLRGSQKELKKIIEG